MSANDNQEVSPLAITYDLQRHVITFDPLPVKARKTSSVAQIHNLSLGRLELPPELLCKVFDELDIGSLDNLRLVNRTAKVMVEASTTYKALVTHASTALRALCLGGLARHFSAGQLHATLQSDRCSNCSNFGPFLFLPSCSRCCYLCLYDTDDFAITTAAHVRDILALTLTDTKKYIRTFKTFSGSYGPLFQKCTKGHLKVSVKEAVGYAVKKHGSEQAARDTARSKALPLRPDLSWWQADPERYQAVVPFPSVPPRSLAQKGIHCRGCLFEYRRRMGLYGAGSIWSEWKLPREIIRCYNKDEFDRHVKRCPGAKRLLAAGNVAQMHKRERPYMF